MPGLLRSQAAASRPWPVNPAARTLVTLDWPYLLEALANHARTETGRRLALALPWIANAAAVEEAFDAIEEIHSLRERRLGAPPVGGIEDIEPALVRAARAETLDLPTVGSVAATLGAMEDLQEFLRRHSATSPALSRLGEPIDLDRSLCRAFATALDEHGQLSATTWPQLGELRRHIASLERSMRTMLEAMLESPEYADVLQDRYVTVRGDRFVLPIKAHAKGLGLGIVHDASRSERTVFVEPAAVVPVGNQRRMAEAELKEEERRILAELSATLGKHAASLRGALTAATSLDVACARADLAAQLGGARPKVGCEGMVRLQEARHPVLALGSREVIANNLDLSATRPILVLTGPNAGGKTVAMKTIGLCALLVRAGCFVPAAPGSRVDFFDSIAADIGDTQTVHDGLSSFSAHLTTLRGMLETAGPGSLLLLDEIAAGTDPAQGGSLARAVIERLADAGARIVATTHYTQVKAMGGEDARVEVSALEYRDGQPTYHVVAGAIGESHALAAARRIGLDATLLDRARALMEEGDRALHDALLALDLEKTRAADATERLERMERELAAQQDDAAKREQALTEREQQIRGRARELEKQAAAAMIEGLRRAEEEVQRTLRVLRDGPSREAAAEVRAAIGEAKASAKQAGRDLSAPPPRTPKVGERVRVLGLGVAGEVVAVRGEEVEVQAGVITVRAKITELEILAGAAPQKSAPRRQPPRPQTAPPPEWIDSAMRSATNTLDLRGVRVEDGLERLLHFLDDAMLESREVVFVLHGHGTGAMKSAVRRVLDDSPYVSASAPAPEDQGGDALTMSRLRG